MPTYEFQRGSVTVELNTPTMPTRDQINRAFQAAEARQQGNERMGDYVTETIRNIPRDVVDQVSGVGRLVQTLGGATAELGTDIGSVARDVVGLDPNYLRERPNLQTLGRIPGALIDHFSGYFDPNERALMVREHPIGTALDVAGVTSAARAGVSRAGTGARAIGPRLKAAVTHPLSRAARGLVSGNPVRIVGALADAVDQSVPAPTPAASPASPAASAPAAATPPVPPVARTPAQTPPAAPSPTQASPVPAHDTAGRTLHTRWADRTPGQQSVQSVRNDVGIAAKRAKVELSKAGHQVAEQLVRNGKTPVEAVAEIAGRPAAPAAAQSMPRMRLNADEMKEYARLVKAGKSDVEAKLAIAQQRELVATTGATPLPKARSRVASRQATGKWPSGTP